MSVVDATEDWEVVLEPPSDAETDLSFSPGRPGEGQASGRSLWGRMFLGLDLLSRNQEGSIYFLGIVDQ